jgi:hypothetical protein
MMTQNDELAKVKAKIRALAAQTVLNGCYETEALIAAEHVGRLLAQYNLSMSEVDVREEKCVYSVVDLGVKKMGAEFNFTAGIGALCDLKWWTCGRQRYSPGVTLHLYGLEPDVEMAKYLFDVIRAAQKNELNGYRRTSDYHASHHIKRSATHAFKYGFAVRVYQRLNELKANRIKEQELRAKEAPTGRSLIVLKGQLVNAEFKLFSQEKKLKLRTIKQTVRTKSSSAYSAGKSAGEKVNLSRPLTKSEPAGYLT